MNGRTSNTQAPDTAFHTESLRPQRWASVKCFLSYLLPLHIPLVTRPVAVVAPGSLYSCLHCSAGAAAAVESGVEPHWPPIEMWSLDNNGRALVPWLYLCVDVSV